jgi:riboflavin kinase/FMN adenylyltransferase
MATQEGVSLLMKTYEDVSEVHLQSAWVTVGSFDGVHLGHQKIISDLVHAAHAANEQAVVVTFFPNPAVFLNNITLPYYLSSPSEKNALLADLGVDVVVTIKFDRKVAKEGAEEFITALRQHLNMKELWVGEGFALGRDREGNAGVLRKLGKKLGFHFHQVGALQADGAPVSSSRIRVLLGEGDAEQAAFLLGRPYRLTGRVIHGESRGKRLGTPTANLEVWNKQLLPRDGIYATWLWWLRKRYPSVTNIGLRPTFQPSDENSIVEPHIIGFDQDLYGQTLTVEFLKYLRPETKFPSISQLKDQIQKDILDAEEIFSHAPKTPGLPARSKAI